MSPIEAIRQTVARQRRAFLEVEIHRLNREGMLRREIRKALRCSDQDVIAVLGPARRKPQTGSVEIPAWVMVGYRSAYTRLALRHDEHHAASRARAWAAKHRQAKGAV